MGSGTVNGQLNHTSGWSMDASWDPDPGLILGDIQHDGHPFAITMSLERVATLSLHKIGAVNVEAFAPGNLTVTNKARWYDYASGTKATLGYYDLAFAVEVDYEMTGLHGEQNQKLVLEHVVAFTDYNKHPTHEPGGILKAARVYPMLRVKSPAITKGAPLDYDNRITSIQAM